MKTVIKATWHLIRYTIATCISMVVSGLLPLLVASIPILMAGAWVLAWILAFVIYLLGGGSMLQDIPMDDPFGIVFVPLMLGGMGAFAVSAILLVIATFNILIVLPVSLVTELVLRLSGRGVTLRLGGFLLSGLLLGTAIASIVMIPFGLYHPDIPAGTLFVSGLLILVMCDCIVFVFGLTLTMLSMLKKVAIRLKDRLGRKKAEQAPDEVQLCAATMEYRA